ncbi:MAG: hydroxyacid dehydrogenase [Anaerolineaceae bacterium]|nr:hydroxyacid dehydrogenase [Anaerolineaceae bacterium]
MISRLIEIDDMAQTSNTIHQDPSLLNNIDILLTGWGCPTLTNDLLNHAPNLKAVFHGAGSIRPIVTDAFWDRNILISSAYQANDIPVAEFALAQILLSLKGYWQHARRFKESGQWWEHLPTAGVYGSTVGLVSLGMIGRMVAEHLKRFDVHVIAYDPFATQDLASQLNLKLCTLDEIFNQADVVSLHTPLTPETEGMITGKHIEMMRPGATLINTARGGIIRQDEMVAVMKKRLDLLALLDVTTPEPPLHNSVLLQLPNIVLSPHLAGANDVEAKRNGRLIVDEVNRFMNCEPLSYVVTCQQAAKMA